MAGEKKEHGSSVQDNYFIFLRYRAQKLLKSISLTQRQCLIKSLENYQTLLDTKLMLPTRPIETEMPLC
jgi:hypothetical protein